LSAPLTQAYVALGSNLGDSHAHLDAAIAALAARDDIESVQESPRYRSAPMGPQDQPDYLNSVCGLRTSLSALSLLTVLRGRANQ